MSNCFFSCKFFLIFGHQNPGSGSVFSLKCWIRIRTHWIRIRNTGFFTPCMFLYEPIFPDSHNLFTTISSEWIRIRNPDPDPGGQKCSVADPGCLSRIPDPTFFHPGFRIRTVSISDPNCLHPGSWIRIKEFKYFSPKKLFLSYRKYDAGCSSQIPDPGVKKAPDPGSGSATLQKWPTKVEKIKKFHVWNAGCSLLRAEGFFCNLDVLYGGLGIGKL